MKILSVDEPSTWEHTAFTSIRSMQDARSHKKNEKSQVLAPTFCGFLLLRPAVYGKRLERSAPRRQAAAREAQTNRQAPNEHALPTPSEPSASRRRPEPPEAPQCEAPSGARIARLLEVDWDRSRAALHHLPLLPPCQRCPGDDCWPCQKLKHLRPTQRARN